MSENIYNKTKVYDTEIRPHVDAIINVCARDDIPFFSTFAVANTEDKTTYLNRGMFTGSADITLHDDLFKNILLLFCGGKVLPPTDIIDINEGINTMNTKTDEEFDHLLSEEERELMELSEEEAESEEMDEEIDFEPLANDAINKKPLDQRRPTDDRIEQELEDGAIYTGDL